MAKVLVIDDEASIAILVAEIIESYGHEVTIAHNGRQGLELIKTGIFKMVISDIMMPYHNGNDLLKVVRSEGRLANTCFVLMSAVAHLAHLDSEPKADAFVVKPFDISVIDKLVQNFLGAPASSAELGRARTITMPRPNQNQPQRLNYADN